MPRGNRDRVEHSLEWPHQWDEEAGTLTHQLSHPSPIRDHEQPSTLVCLSIGQACNCAQKATLRQRLTGIKKKKKKKAFSQGATDFGEFSLKGRYSEDIGTNTYLCEGHRH